jgi:hypothetical protein
MYDGVPRVALKLLMDVNRIFYYTCTSLYCQTLMKDD